MSLAWPFAICSRRCHTLLTSQKKVINDLIRYYQTGEHSDWIACGIDWVRDKSNPDFSNGFVEVYKDPRGQKGAIQGIRYRGRPENESMMTAFAANAGYFEQHAPWLDQYKNPESQTACRECDRDFDRNAEPLRSTPSATICPTKTRYTRNMVPRASFLRDRYAR